MDCPTCGKSLPSEQDMRQHHTRVHGDPLPNRTCSCCGVEFEYYPSNRDGVYCPDCVAEADEFLGDHYVEVHDIEPVDRTCESCGSEFSLLPCHVRNDGGRFCSHDCFSSWLSHQWGDGTAVYNRDWLPVKRQTSQRNDHRCQYCGTCHGSTSEV